MHPTSAKTALKSHLLRSMVIAVSAVGTLMATAGALADTFTPVGIGTLPDGNIVENYQFTGDPGECFPWHYHPGLMQVIILGGSASEDKGCGQPLRTYNAGDAFYEQPGEYHHICVTSSVPLSASVTGVLPACFGNFADEIDVSAGPACGCDDSSPLFAPGPYLCTDGSGAHTPAATLANPVCSGQQDLECSGDEHDGQHNNGHHGGQSNGQHRNHHGI
jgi:quercetin dioxygenase-like cupin family protein